MSEFAKNLATIYSLKRHNNTLGLSEIRHAVLPALTSKVNTQNWFEPLVELLKEELGGELFLGPPRASDDVCMDLLFQPDGWSEASDWFLDRATAAAFQQQVLARAPPYYHDELASIPEYAPLAPGGKREARGSQRALIIERRSGPRYGGRVLTNQRALQEEILDVFRIHTQSLRLAAQPLWEQAELFRKATVVVAAHGGAVTNLLWMRPCSILVELFPFNFYRPHYFASLADKLRVIHTHWYDAKPKETADCMPLPMTAPWMAEECMAQGRCRRCAQRGDIRVKLSQLTRKLKSAMRLRQRCLSDRSFDVQPRSIKELLSDDEEED